MVSESMQGRMADVMQDPGIPEGEREHILAALSEQSVREVRSLSASPNTAQP